MVALLSRIGASPLGRAGLASIAILSLAGLAAGALPLACKVSVYCGDEGAGLQPDKTAKLVDGQAPHPAADAANLSPEGRGGEVAKLVVEPAAGASPVQKETAVAELGQLPSVTANDLLAATFALLEVELSGGTQELATRKVKTVSIGPDGLPIGAAPQPAVEVAAVSPEESAAASEEPVASEEPRSSEAPVAVTAVAPEPIIEESSEPLAYAPAVSGDGATVTGKGANVRSAPNKGKSQVLFALAGGEEVTVVQMSRGWAKVVDKQGRSGWIYGEYLRRG